MDVFGDLDLELTDVSVHCRIAYTISFRYRESNAALRLPDD